MIKHKLLINQQLTKKNMLQTADKQSNKYDSAGYILLNTSDDRECCLLV